MSKVTPFLWFDTQAEDAAKYYVSVFKNAKILNVVRYGDAGPGPKGSVMVIEFEVEGQKFTGLNGGPHHKFDEAISFVVDCKDQAEVDYFWDRLGDGGRYDHCGWVRDKFGLSWQVVPRQLNELLSHSDAVKANRVMQAMLKMSKIEIAELERAAA